MKKALIFGAGNIGRGLVGRLFYQAGYSCTFIDINSTVISELNKKNNYPVFITKANEYSKKMISNVDAVNAAAISKIVELSNDVDIVATAVGVNALSSISMAVGAIIANRFRQKDNRYLNFILCENMKDSHIYVRSNLKKHLSEEQYAFAEEYIGFCQASIGCMVPVPPKELTEQNPLSVVVENYSIIYVDKDGLRGELPYIENINAYSPFSFYIERKLYMHNMSHSLCAYMGWKKGYKYIWEAIQDEEILKKVSRALEETASALYVFYKDIEMSDLNEHSEELLKRYANRLLGDTTARVAADPKRKLAANDRFIGAARFCMDNSIMPASIIDTIPLIFRYDEKEDISAPEVNQYFKERGIAEALKKYCSLTETDPIYSRILAADKKYENEEGHDNKTNNS